MNFIDSVRICFLEFAVFKGRSRRSEFWWFQLAYFLIMIPMFVLAGLFGFLAMDLSNSGDPSTGSAMGIMVVIGVGVLFVLGTIIPQISLTVRRLHDAGQSGWMYLLTMVPYIGSIAWIIFGVLETQPRENKWGPVPGEDGGNSLRNALVDFDEENLV